MWNPTITGSTPGSAPERSFLKDFLTGKSPSLTSFPALSPEQQAALKSLLGSLTPGATGVTPYTGQLTAPLNAAQNLSLTALEQQAMNAVSGDTQAASTKALTDIMGATPQDLTSYYQSAIVDPAMKVFEQQVMPDLTRRFAGQAGFGSDRMVQEGIAAGNTMSGISQAMAQASQQSLLEQQRNKLAAAEALPGVTQAGTQNILDILSGGTAYQQLQQQPLTAQYQEYQRQLQQQQANIQDLLQALGIQVNIPVVTPGTGGFLQGAAGGIGSSIGGLLAK